MVHSHRLSILSFHHKFSIGFESRQFAELIDFYNLPEKKLKLFCSGIRYIILLKNLFITNLLKKNVFILSVISLFSAK